MSGFRLTITTEDEEQLWSVSDAPAVPTEGEIVYVSEPSDDEERGLLIQKFRVLRREWDWQEADRTFGATVYVEPVVHTEEER